MNTQESLRQIANLRLRFQMNRRLRLESLAALSRVFREHGEPLEDELLASLVFALPEELLGNGGPAHSSTLSSKGGQPGRPLEGPARPPEGPARPPEGPARPPEGPARPPEGPARPPEGPARPPAGPASPPEEPAGPEEPARPPEDPAT
jgi:hypothetical protein